jgi:putative heme transporter
MKELFASRWFRAVLSLAVVVVIFGFFFPKVADYGEVWDTIAAMTPLEIGTLLAVASWNIASYWPLLTAVQPGLRLREAAVANLSSTAVANTVPGGGAIGVGVTMTMQRTWGIPLSDTALAIVVSGVWNNFVKLGLPVVALALLAVSGQTSTGLLAAALVGLAVLAVAVGLFALLLRSERMAARLGGGLGRFVSSLRRPFRKGPVEGWDRRAVTFRAEVVVLLERRWLRITVFALISHLSLFAVLLVALRHVGVSNAEVSWQEALAAFAFVRLLSAVPVTPGGLGFVELGLTASLGSGLPDTTKSQIAAAVLVFRALTWLLPVPLGAGTWLFWRANHTWRQTVEERQADRRYGAGQLADPAPVA